MSTCCMDGNFCDFPFCDCDGNAKHLRELDWSKDEEILNAIRTAGSEHKYSRQRTVLLALDRADPKRLSSLIAARAGQEDPPHDQRTPSDAGDSPCV